MKLAMHHYAICNAPLCINMQTSITHYYAPLHYLQKCQKFIRNLKFLLEITFHTRPLRTKLMGELTPPSNFVRNDA